MQRLHMSAENQDMVRDMLKNLHEDEEQEEEFVHDNRFLVILSTLLHELSLRI